MKKHIGRVVVGTVALFAVACVCPFASATNVGQPDPIGSLKNARIAYPLKSGEPKPELVMLAGELTDAQVAELKQLAPNVKVLHHLTRQQAMEHAGEAHAIDARFATPELIAKAPKLVWVQAMSAGVDHLVKMDGIASSEKVVLTNMRAVHGPAIADHAFAMLLTLTRNMRDHLEHQAQGEWGGRDDGPGAIALAGRTMLVVGIGGIGTEIAQRAHGFGMRVTAIRRSDSPAPEYVAKLGHAEDLKAMVADADVVAVCVPLTKETEGMFDDAVFAAMKPGSYLINIARGKIVKTDSLVKAIDSGKLAGACLDVTDPEPLPKGHVLWGKRNVVITPHSAADAELTMERRWAVYKENVKRFGAGEPLVNVVDVKAGY